MFEWLKTGTCFLFAHFSNVEMAATLNVTESSDSDLPSSNDQSVSNRSSNRSLRVAEKERRKNEAEDPLVVALKYFSDGRSYSEQTQQIRRD